MRIVAVVLPDLGTGRDEPIVVSHWFAELGDEVWQGDRLVEVTVGPATFDVSVPSTGLLARIESDLDIEVSAGTVLGFVAVPEDSDDTTTRPPDVSTA